MKTGPHVPLVRKPYLRCQAVNVRIWWRGGLPIQCTCRAIDGDYCGMHAAAKKKADQLNDGTKPH